MDFVECDESFLQSNSPDILTLSETNLDDSIYSSNLSVKGYLTLIQKDTVTDSGLAVYVMEGLPFVQNLSLEKSVYSFLCFWLALLQLVSYYFFLYWSPFVAISSHTDDVPSISLSTNVFVFGDFNVRHEDWLFYSGGTDRPGELCYSFCISNDLTQMVNFSTRIPVTLTILFFWISFFLLMLVFVLQGLSLLLKILIMFLSQFPLTFRQTQNWMPYFIV